VARAGCSSRRHANAIALERAVISPIVSANVGLWPKDVAPP